MFRRLSDRVAVAPQIMPDDVAVAARDGFTAIVNNRPDGEVAGQPAGAEIAAACTAAGIAYRHVPMAHGAITPEMINAVGDVLAAHCRTLMFCRSGTRSSLLWGLAEARAGSDPEALAAAAAAQGYDLSPVMAAMQQLRAARP
jgi:uncharacterized protein (TIGR01244 family)